jgi:hypothetical protein
MLFWPIVIALGPGFVALYYDHDVKAFDDQGTCEQTLPGLEQRARQAKEFMGALGEADWRPVVDDQMAAHLHRQDAAGIPAAPARASRLGGH